MVIPDRAYYVGVVVLIQAALGCSSESGVIDVIPGVVDGEAGRPGNAETCDDESDAGLPSPEPPPREEDCGELPYVGYQATLAIHESAGQPGWEILLATWDVFCTQLQLVRRLEIDVDEHIATVTDVTSTESLGSKAALIWNSDIRLMLPGPEEPAQSIDGLSLIRPGFNAIIPLSLDYWACGLSLAQGSDRWQVEPAFAGSVYGVGAVAGTSEGTGEVFVFIPHLLHLNEYFSLDQYYTLMDIVVVDCREECCRAFAYRTNDLVPGLVESTPLSLWCHFEECGILPDDSGELAACAGERLQRRPEVDEMDECDWVRLLTDPSLYCEEECNF